jgi:hypothetical protein
MKLAPCLVLIVLGSAFGVQAQSIQIPASWDKLAAKADEVDNVTLDKSMLGLASKFIKDDDDAEGPEINRLLSRLKAIYVRHLEFKAPGEFTDADVQPVRAQLAGPEWTQIIDVKDKESKQNVGVYIKTINHETLGMVILAEEPTELTFVHLDGPIDLADIGPLSGNFGIPKGLQLREKKQGMPAPPSPDVKK